MSETGCFVIIATLVAMIILLLVQDYLNRKAFKELSKTNDELFFKVMELNSILNFSSKEDKKEEEK